MAHARVAPSPTLTPTLSPTLTPTLTRTLTRTLTQTQVVALLCVLKLLAAIGAILAILPLTAKHLPPVHLGGYVPCLHATPWVAESAALGLVILTTTVNIFLSRHENNDRYKHLTPPAALY